MGSGGGRGEVFTKDAVDRMCGEYLFNKYNYTLI